MSLFLNAINREAYPLGEGILRSTFTVGNSEPTTDLPEFTAITETDGVYNAACNVTYNNIEVGFNENTYGPEVFGWRGPIICQDTLMFDWQVENFLRAYIPQLTEFAQRTIENRFAAIYTHLVPKWVANTNLHKVAGSTGRPPAAPVLTLDESHCFLDQEMLDVIAVDLIQVGAGNQDNPTNPGMIIQGEDGPLFPLFIGIQASQQILLQNAELRQDRRYADMGKGNMAMLFQRLGATKMIRNFRHVINPFPPRYTYSGGAYTRVPTWIQENGTKGKVSRINPTWDSQDGAPFEGAWVVHPLVFTSESIRSPDEAASLTWSPKSHAGVFKWVTGGQKISTTQPCYDPLEKLGAHFAEFWHAPKPIFPEYGAFIIFRRCPGSNLPCTNCS